VEYRRVQCSSSGMLDAYCSSSSAKIVALIRLHSGTVSRLMASLSQFRRVIEIYDCVCLHLCISSQGGSKSGKPFIAASATATGRVLQVGSKELAADGVEGTFQDTGTLRLCVMIDTNASTNAYVNVRVCISIEYLDIYMIYVCIHIYIQISRRCMYTSILSHTPHAYEHAYEHIHSMFQSFPEYSYAHVYTHTDLLWSIGFDALNHVSEFILRAIW